MIDKQEAEAALPRAPGSAGGGAASRRAGLPGRLAGLALALVLTGCAAAEELTQSPEEAAAEQPQRISTEGASDAFPNLAEVPDEAKPSIAPEDRERLMSEMIRDRAQAVYTQPEPLEAQAAPDYPTQGVIISGDGTITTASRSAFGEAPLTTAAGGPAGGAAGGGQLAAIIFFGHGSADLDVRDRSVLSDIAALHRQHGGRLTVVGHASSRTQNTTPDEHQIANFDMSMVRAEAVEAELVALGVAPDVIQTDAVGDAEPVYHEFMPSGEAGNRRVEIFLEN